MSKQANFRNALGNRKICICCSNSAAKVSSSSNFANIAISRKLMRGGISPKLPTHSNTCMPGMLFIETSRFVPACQTMKLNHRIMTSNYLLCGHLISHLQPENMLLAEDGSLKIADFGWAVHAPAPHDVRRTLCGTPEYLAPEMLSRAGHTCAVDVWGLGIMAYELLCGTIFAFLPR